MSELNDLSKFADGQFDALRLALSERRQELGITMTELARRVGVSPSLVSQIERGQTLPSVPTLFALASELGATVDAFFSAPPAEANEDEAQQSTRATELRSAGSSVVINRRDTAGDSQPREHLYVVRHSHRAAVDIRGGVHWERLTPTSIDDAEFLELIYQPRATSNSELYRHPGIEMLVVLEGTFAIDIGFERYVLEEGDSALFPSSLPHRYTNPTDHVSRAVTVILRDHMGDDGGGPVQPSYLAGGNDPPKRKDVR